jgi:uncharacterized membrane protein (DUF4010 family)
MSEHLTPLRDHFKSKELWIDTLILMIVWFISIGLKHFLTDPKYSILLKLTHLTALMASIEMIGFFALHLFGKKKGVFVQGFIGGFISSTMIYIQFGDKEKMKAFYARDIVGALILSTISMLSLCILLVLTITSGNPVNIWLPFMFQIIGLIFCHFLILSLLPRNDIHDNSTLISIDNPIIWKNVLKFTLFFACILYGLKWMATLLPDSYLVTTFIISLFESHAILAAFLSEIDFIQEKFQSEWIISLILLGNLVSKIFLVSRSEISGIKIPVTLSLIGSFLLSFVAYLF